MEAISSIINESADGVEARSDSIASDYPSMGGLLDDVPERGGNSLVNGERQTFHLETDLVISSRDKEGSSRTQKNEGGDVGGSSKGKGPAKQEALDTVGGNLTSASKKEQAEALEGLVRSGNLTFKTLKSFQTGDIPFDQAWKEGELSMAVNKKSGGGESSTMGGKNDKKKAKRYGTVVFTYSRSALYPFFNVFRSVP